MKPALQILVRRLRDLFSVARSKVSALLRKPGDGASAPAESVIVYEPERTRDWLEEKLRERESELAALKTAHADELRRRDAALADAKKDARELQAKIAELETAKAETRSAREAEKKALRDEQERSRAALDDAKRAHESKVASLNAEHARELAAKNAELAAAKAETRSASTNGDPELYGCFWVFVVLASVGFYLVCLSLS